ncbi:BatD family protein [bacterium]|nr:BatD family protein [bacterium]
MIRIVFSNNILKITATMLLLLVAVLPGTAAAEEYFRAHISNPSPNLGDALQYTIEVMTAGEKQYSPDITPPDLKRYFQVGEIIGRSSVSILNGKTHIVNFKEVNLVANRKGEFSIPPAQIELIDSGTNQRIIRKTNSITMLVNEATGETALPTPTPEIDVLKPVKKSAHISLSQWLPFAIGIALIILNFIIMYYLKHRPEPKLADPEPVDPRTPEQRAYDELEDALKLKAAGKIDEFYTSLSMILRRYMAGTFGFKAEEATTREMISEMEKLEFKPDFLEQYRGYFMECDKVKFANVAPTPDNVEAAAPKVKELIKHPEKRAEPEPVIDEEISGEEQTFENEKETEKVE